jgi:hypothetical protein
MNGKLEDFELAMQSLKGALVDVFASNDADETAKRLFDLLCNQLQGMEMFYQLLLCEVNGKFMMNDRDYDLLTQKYRTVLKFFTRFPGVDEKSIYEMLVVGDFYYLLSHHASEPRA